MLSLLGYAIVSILIVLFLKPFLKIDRNIGAYAFPFGIIYIILLSSADGEMFDVFWYRYMGIAIGIFCELIFLFEVFRQHK
jgi:tellurite resistance protein TehA-like permease